MGGDGGEPVMSHDREPVRDWVGLIPRPIPLLESGPVSHHCYTPVRPALERRAYEAAHRILQAHPRVDLALPSARRVSYIDAIAKIIMDTMDGGLDPDGSLDRTRPGVRVDGRRMVE